MKNPLSIIARVSVDGVGENGPDDVHFFYWPYFARVVYFVSLEGIVLVLEGRLKDCVLWIFPL
jgi:hypothetical protein